MNPKKWPALILGLILKPFKLLGKLILTFFKKIVSAIKPALRLFRKMSKNFIHKLGTMFPTNIKESLEDMLLVSGLTHNPEEALGMTFIYSLTVPAAVFVLGYALTEYATAILSVITFASFLAIWVVFYVSIVVIIDRRAKNVEEVLPDLLMMISQNMRAGMTPYNALWASAKPEFGPLAIEIQHVARDTLAGASFEEALQDMTTRIRSSRLERVVSLMIQGMQSGGELPEVLQEISDDTRRELNLVKRMKTETTTQVMFIAFALVFGAPLLFSASNQFVVIFSKTLGSLNIPEDAMTSSMVSISEFPVSSSPDCGYIEPKCEGQFNFKAYCIYALILSSVFGSLLMGLMRTGYVSSASGLSMVLVITVISIIVFYTLNTLFHHFFGSMIS